MPVQFIDHGVEGIGAAGSQGKLAAGPGQGQGVSGDGECEAVGVALGSGTIRVS